MGKDGTLRICSARDYGRDGFVVEEYGHHPRRGDLAWYVPGWIEDRWGRSAFFETFREAREFIRMVAA